MNDAPKILSAILALMSAIAGWYYMFYSRAAHRLSTVETEPVNRQRIRLRRVNGFAMFLLAIGLFAGVWSVDHLHNPGAFLLIWSAVFILLLLVVIFALMDLRLTVRLRRGRSIDSQEKSP